MLDNKTLSFRILLTLYILWPNTPLFSQAVKDPLRGAAISAALANQPQFFISTFPSLLMEGRQTQTHVWFDRSFQTDQTVQLSASSPGFLNFPNQVVVPAGSVGATFLVQADQNNLPDDDRTVTLTASTFGALQAGIDIHIKNDDPNDGHSLRLAAQPFILNDTNNNGIFEADEIADILFEVHNSGNTFQVNSAVAIEVVNAFNLDTLGSGTCIIGGIQAGRIEGCDVSLIADEELPTGRYYLKVTMTSNSDTSVDVTFINIVNNALPDFQLSQNGLSSLSVMPGEVISRRYIGLHRDDGFSPDLPLLAVFIEDGQTTEILTETYMEIRGNLFDEWVIDYEVAAPMEPGVYQIWGEINPPGPAQLNESNVNNNLSRILTLTVEDDGEHDTIGVFRSANNFFYLDLTGDFLYAGANSNDGRFRIGTAGDLPLAGDFNGDGFDNLGVFRPSNNTFHIDLTGDNLYSGTGAGDGRFRIGTLGDLPLVGDFNGDGVDNLGVFRPSNNTFYIDLTGDNLYSGTGTGDGRFRIGTAGDLPLIGDFNGDGFDNLGVFRPSNNSFYIDLTGNNLYDGANNGDASFRVGTGGDVPLVGDWNDDGFDNLGVFRPSSNLFFIDLTGDNLYGGSGGGDGRFFMGTAGDAPLSGRF